MVEHIATTIAHIIAWFVQHFWVVQSIAAVVSVLLLVGIIYYIIKLDYFGDYASATKKEQKKEWDKVLNGIKSANPALWKEAFERADALLAETFRAAGYKGFNVEQVLAYVYEEQVPGVEELKKERQALTTLLAQEGFVPERNQVKKVLRVYREVLSRFGIS
jgi:hypothetical protein